MVMGSCSGVPRQAMSAHRIAPSSGAVLEVMFCAIPCETAAAWFEYMWRQYLMPSASDCRWITAHAAVDGDPRVKEAPVKKKCPMCSDWLMLRGSDR
eukprot:6700774-Pyramimonas_sp.AAC.1